MEKALDYFYFALRREKISPSLDTQLPTSCGGYELVPSPSSFRDRRGDGFVYVSIARLCWSESYRMTGSPSCEQEAEA